MFESKCCFLEREDKNCHHCLTKDLSLVRSVSLPLLEKNKNA